MWNKLYLKSCIILSGKKQLFEWLCQIKKEIKLQKKDLFLGENKKNQSTLKENIVLYCKKMIIDNFVKELMRESINFSIVFIVKNNKSTILEGFWFFFVVWESLFSCSWNLPTFRQILQVVVVRVVTLKKKWPTCCKSAQIHGKHSQKRRFSVNETISTYSSNGFKRVGVPIVTKYCIQVQKPMTCYLNAADAPQIDVQTLEFGLLCDPFPERDC